MKSHLISHKRYLDFTAKYTINNKDDRLYLMDKKASQSYMPPEYERTVKSMSGTVSIKNDSSVYQGSQA
jgi:hypothetical protein